MHVPQHTPLPHLPGKVCSSSPTLRPKRAYLASFSRSLSHATCTAAELRAGAGAAAAAAWGQQGQGRER